MVKTHKCNKRRMRKGVNCFEIIYIIESLS